MKVLHEAGMGGGGAVTPRLTFHLRGEHVNADVAVATEHSSSAPAHKLGRLEAKPGSKRVS